MSKVKFCLISDTHGKHQNITLPEADVLIHAGDWMNSGIYWDEVYPFADWWNKQPHPVKILIGGNHDILLEKHTSLVLEAFENTIYLENSETWVEGFKVYGSPVTPRFFDWAWNVDRGPAIRKYWDKIPEDTDILITHGPPLGYLDQSYQNGEHLGCEELAAVMINRVFRPKLHVFGHIHGLGSRQVTSKYTHYVNASQVDEAYRLVNKPIVVELENGR